VPAAPMSPDDVQQLMTAMVNVVLGRNDTTKDLVSVQGAEEAMLEILMADPRKWLAWFSDPQNLKPAITMRTALTPALRAQLSNHPEGAAFIRSLDDIVSSSVMHVFTPVDKAVDIRESALVDAL
jgi:hypothetical protein